MRDCARHPSESHPGGGVCASCLRERLTSLWKGESFRLSDAENPLPPCATAPHELTLTLPSQQPERVDSVANAREALEVVDGVATDRFSSQVWSDGVVHEDHSIRADVVVPSSGESVGAPRNPSPQSNSKDIRLEWTEFHARRRGDLNLEVGDLRKAKSRSFDSLELNPEAEVVMAADNARRGPPQRSPQLSILMSAQKLRTRSMPLDNRGAEDTASRVIREQGDVLYMDDLDFLEGLQDRDGDGGGGTVLESTPTRKITPKWVRVLISPMTSRNKVFPSRSKDEVRKSRSSRKRLSRFASSDWSHPDCNGDASPHWMDALRAKDGISDGRRRSSVRSSVFSWLQQDSEKAKTRKYVKRDIDLTDQLSPSFSSPAMDYGSTDTLLRDLITVGHLHEIAEEIEEEDEVLNLDSLDDIDSFGKFLLSAAKRQSNAGLTRLSSM